MNGRSVDVLHHEVRLPARGRPGIEHARDVVVTHARERRTLGLEAPQHRSAVHPELDDLQRHPPHERLTLFGQVDGPHAPFAKDLEDRIGTDLSRMRCRIVDHPETTGRIAPRAPYRVSHFLPLPLQRALPSSVYVAWTWHGTSHRLAGSLASRHESRLARRTMFEGESDIAVLEEQLGETV